MYILYLVSLNRAYFNGSRKSCIASVLMSGSRNFQTVYLAVELYKFTEQASESQMYGLPGLEEIRSGLESDLGSETSH